MKQGEEGTATLHRFRLADTAAAAALARSRRGRCSHSGTAALYSSLVGPYTKCTV